MEDGSKLLVTFWARVRKVVEPCAKIGWEWSVQRRGMIRANSHDFLCALRILFPALAN